MVYIDFDYKILKKIFHTFLPSIHIKQVVYFSFRISLKVADGELIAIVGSVAAGKSSLLTAIVGEMEKVSGSVKVKVLNLGSVTELWVGSQSYKRF